MTEKKTLTQEIADLLKQNAEELPEGYTGVEYIEAIELLPSDTVLDIPFCIADIVTDDRGVTVMESEYTVSGRHLAEKEDGTRDEKWRPRAKRRSRFDVLAVLLLIPLKRETPEMLLEDVTKMISEDNVKELSRFAYKFWGVDLDEIGKQLDEIEADATEDNQQAEVEDTGDFPE